MHADPFNPTSDYQVPKGEKGYLKFEEGDTEFLPLQSPILGWLYWNTAGKPVRLKEQPDGIPEDIRIGKDGKPEPVKHFWALAVFDMTPGARRPIKVLELTQSSIMKAIRTYTKNPKWGSPVLKYSFTINRDESGDITRYTIMANPAQEIGQDIRDAWEAAQAAGFDIERLFTGGDPFSADSAS
jgi:hypothetical protein